MTGLNVLSALIGQCAPLGSTGSTLPKPQTPVVVSLLCIKLVVHKMAIPSPLYIRDDEADGIDSCVGMGREAGERLAASYANYLITNNGIILPLLDPAKDSDAVALLRDLYPCFEVVGVEAREILLGGGNIHCITQQVPAV